MHKNYHEISLHDDFPNKSVLKIVSVVM